MKQSTKVRYIIFQILIDIYKKNKNFDEVFIKKTHGVYLDKKDISFINNICLNSMRYNFHSKLILRKITKKKLKINQFILLSSALVQIVYLNIKPYAVVNDSVEIAKITKVYPGFVNAVLQNISRNKINIKSDTKIKKENFPSWFIKELKKNKQLDIEMFIETFFNQPKLHIVFKSENLLNKFKAKHIKTSKKSAFIEVNKKVSELESFEKGDWWVQDFSSMISIEFLIKKENDKILDMCSAPGGKAFQLLSDGYDVTLNDISKKRIIKLKENLQRLNLKSKIINSDALKIKEDNKFDIILIDSPCSSVGTLRKNPELLFKSNRPNLKKLNKLQLDLLKKSSKLLNKNGIILYMVCSFLYSETLEPINKFLSLNKEFKILKIPNSYMIKHNIFINKNYFLTAPTKYVNDYIDGFFAIQIKKNV